MRRILLSLALLAVFAASRARGDETTTRKAFVPGGAIRLHLDSGGYKILPSDSDAIAVTPSDRWDDDSSPVRIEIRTSGAKAEVSVRHTQRNNFRATIEVPRRSNLWIRLSAGELDIDAIQGDKDIEAWAGQIVVDVGRPDDYGHRDASVLAGDIVAPAFDVSTGGLFRSFSQSGPGRFHLHAHVLAGEIDLRGGR